MTGFSAGARGFTAIDSVLIIVAVILIGFAASTALSKLNHNSFVPSPVSTTQSRSFPGGHLSFQLSPSWQFAIVPDKFSGDGPGLVTTKQTADYGYAEYATTISGPTTLSVVEPIDCGLCGGTAKLQDFVITIADFGTASYTSADKWYQSTLGKTFDDPLASPALVQSGANYLSEESASTQHSWAKIGGQPAYCISVLNSSTTSLQYPNDLPAALSTGECYILWSNRVYFIKVTDNTTANVPNLPESVSIDRGNAIKLLTSLEFK